MESREPAPWCGASFGYLIPWFCFFGLTLRSLSVTGHCMVEPLPFPDRHSPHVCWFFRKLGWVSFLSSLFAAATFGADCGWFVVDISTSVWADVGLEIRRCLRRSCGISTVFLYMPLFSSAVSIMASYLALIREVAGSNPPWVLGPERFFIGKRLFT